MCLHYGANVGGLGWVEESGGANFWEKSEIGGMVDI